MADETSETRDALIALVELGQSDEEAFRAELSEDERRQVGTPDQWAQKEVIAHLGYWKHRQIARVDAVARGEDLPSGPDWGQLNTETWPEHARLSWEESVALSDHATRDLIAALQRVPASVMVNPDDRNSPANLLIATTLGNSLGHVAEHMANYYHSRGQLERASLVQQEAVQAITRANLGPSHEGSARYNLACYYALHNEPDEAISELRQAFARLPDLVPWARQDHDLDSLRDDPGFQALVPPESGEGV